MALVWLSVGYQLALGGFEMALVWLWVALVWLYPNLSAFCILPSSFSQVRSLNRERPEIPEIAEIWHN